MISFFLTFYRFIKVILSGIKNDQEFRFLLIFVTVLIGIAVLFYTTYEGWSVVDSIYFAVMTMATIGYGDFVPTTPLSKTFTVIFAFLSIGAFVSLTAFFLKLSFKSKKLQDEHKAKH